MSKYKNKIFILWRFGLVVGHSFP